MSPDERVDIFIKKLEGVVEEKRLKKEELEKRIASRKEFLDTFQEKIEEGEQKEIFRQIIIVNTREREEEVGFLRLELSADSFTLRAADGRTAAFRGWEDLYGDIALDNSPLSEFLDQINEKTEVNCVI